MPIDLVTRGTLDKIKSFELGLQGKVREGEQHSLKLLAFLYRSNWRFTSSPYELTIDDAVRVKGEWVM